jgi:hypothetical protein
MAKKGQIEHGHGRKRASQEDRRGVFIHIGANRRPIGGHGDADVPARQTDHQDEHSQTGHEIGQVPAVNPRTLEARHATLLSGESLASVIRCHDNPVLWRGFARNVAIASYSVTVKILYFRRARSDTKRFQARSRA